MHLTCCPVGANTDYESLILTLVERVHFYNLKVDLWLFQNETFMKTRNKPGFSQSTLAFHT
jgi:hypothetical protein